MKATNSQEVVCEKCGYPWTYCGTFRSPIRCPRCHSSRNVLNRKKFGRFKPTRKVK